MAFDRRGTGFTPAGVAADYTFDRATSDINLVIERLRLREPRLLGHSFGGAVGLKFLEKFPGRVDRLILLGAPRHYPGTLLTILDRVISEFPQQIEAAKGSNPEIVGQFEQSFRHAQELRTDMFNGEGDPISGTFTAQNINFIFVLAMNFGLYAPSQPSDQAKKLYKEVSSEPQPPVSREFFRWIQNENYAELDLTSSIASNSEKIYGIYGEEDGLFTQDENERIRELLG